MLLKNILVALWVFFPAYITNASSLLFGGGSPIDGGRTLKDRRVLGDGKTIRGTIAGPSIGIFFGLIMNELLPYFGSWLNITLPSFTLELLVIICTGSAFGDIFASFFKRRIDINRGKPLPIADQVDFILGATLFAFIFKYNWIKQLNLEILITIILITPLIHLSTNFGAYMLKIKGEPW